MRQPKLWISLLILLVLGLHALPVLSYQGYQQTRWPFLTWAMYARSYPPGPIQVVVRRLIARATSGAEREVTYYQVGLSKAAFRNAYLVPLSKHDSVAARELLTRLNQKRDDKLVRIRLEQVRSTLSDTGVAREELPVIDYQAAPGHEVSSP